MEINEKVAFALSSYILNHARYLKSSPTEADRRLQICQKCDKMEIFPPAREEEKEALMERFGKTEPFHGCNVCGCMLEHKVEVLFERCPEEKWYPSIGFMEGGEEQPGDGEQWKKFYDEFMRLYEEKGEKYVDWAFMEPIDLDTIEGESNNE